MAGCSPAVELERDKDQEFDKGSGIRFTGISNNQIENLTKLCKVWGVVKYYHPEVIDGNVNLDYELFRMMPSILEEDVDTNSILYTWVDSLNGEADIESDNEEYTFPEDSIQLRPSTEWCEDKEYLGEQLSNELSSLLEYRISDRQNAYVRFENDSPYTFMDSENPYPNMSFDDTGFRLLSLFRYWNIIEYYYPYKDSIDNHWDDVLTEFIPKIVAGVDYESYLYTLSELTSRINDSHTYLMGKRGNSVSNFNGQYRIPVNFMKIDNKIVISKILQKCGLERGDVVLKVGEEDINERLESRRKYISQSREDTNSLFYLDLFRIPDKEIDVTVVREGKTIDVKVKGIQKDIDMHVETESQEMDNGNIYYINAGLLEDGEIDEIMKNHGDAHGLILDLRNYPSSVIAYDLAEYLIPTEKEFAMFSFPNPAVPGEFYYSFPYVSGRTDESDNDRVYEGKVVILVNEHTISQGETTTMSLRNTPDSIVLGRPTAGTNGDVRPIVLPGEINTSISGLGVFYPDKEPTQRIGLQPDIHMDPTVEGIREGRDEYIEKAIELIKSGI